MSSNNNNNNQNKNRNRNKKLIKQISKYVRKKVGSCYKQKDKQMNPNQNLLTFYLSNYLSFFGIWIIIDVDLLF